MHEHPLFRGSKLCQTGHHESISNDFVGLFCVNPISVGICVAPCYLSGDYFFIFNLCSTVSSF
uniref:Putative ovule protein n=1 Tax=Solanum chacoense TaxID=4108 RepID=A0A0V0HK78_SOLCH